MPEHEAGHTCGSPERPPRQVNAPVQRTRLAEEIALVVNEREGRGADHTALTLRHTPVLRQVLIALHRAGQLPEHRAAGEVAIHVLTGEILVEVAGATETLAAGDILNLASGQPHSVTGTQESVFLLTIAPL